jgi:hypothetical protein
VCEPKQLESRVAAIDPRGRPDAPGTATEVDLGVMLIDMFSIDEVNERFGADLRVELAWRDERLASGSLGCDPTDVPVPLDRVWHPQLVLINSIDANELQKLGALIEPDGRVRLAQRYRGSFSSRMALADFPLETQRLAVVLGTALMGPEQVRVRIDPERSGLFDSTTVAGWTVAASAPELDVARIADREINRIRVVFPAERRPGFFVYKVVLPLALIVAMSWSVFWLDPKHADAQLGVASASMLTVIAFQLSFGDLLPQIPYLTRMDRFVLGSTVFVFAALAESIWTSSLSARDRVSTARRVDGLARFGFPIAYAGHATWCFV